MEKFKSLGQADGDELVEKQFRWRSYVCDIEGISSENQAKLNALEDLINQCGSDTKEFIDCLNVGEYRKPILSLVQFFRDILNPTERAQLLDQIRKAGSRASPVGRINDIGQT